MFTVIAFNMLPLLIAFIIGMATGWWIWARASVDANATIAAATPIQDAPPIPVVPVPAAAPPAPIAVPQPLVATPVLAKAEIAEPEPAQAKPATPALAAVSDSATGQTPLGLAAAVGAPDDLLTLKGVGPKLNALLISLGVTRFDQIAAWSDADIATVDAHLGSFKGRIVREAWVEQAGLLARGEITAFEAKFGKLDSENA